MCFCAQSSHWNSSFSFELNRLTSSFKNELKTLKIDDKEIALMLCLLIVSIDSKPNSSSKILFKHIDEELFSTLYDYMSGKFNFNDHSLSISSI